MGIVVPYIGTWIETDQERAKAFSSFWSYLIQVRGLKRQPGNKTTPFVQSYLIQVRGLKQDNADKR